MKHFNLGLAWRLALLFACMMGLSAVFWNSNYPFTQITLASLVIALIIEIIRFVRQTNADLAKFLLALKYEDGSVRFSKPKTGAKFDDLRYELERILQFIENKSLKDVQRQYALSTIFDALPVGLVVLRNGEVYLRNAYAKTLLNAHPSDAQLQTWLNGLNQNEKVITYGSNELAVQSTAFHTDEQFAVYAFTEITEIGEQRETEAYQKLIRILTHEIMNSVTSISSLSATLLDVAKRQSFDSQVVEALASINKRSAGMLTFVESYRKITHVPAPSKTWFQLLPLVRELAIPFSKASDLTIAFSGEDSIKIYADRNQISQVIINLFLNAQHATESKLNGKVDIELEQKGQEIKLVFSDNGHGIEPRDMKDIFTPFFSTRESGSGIGLSLSRQIMRNNNGAIGVSSIVGKGTSFVLRFSQAG